MRIRFGGEDPQDLSEVAAIENLANMLAGGLSALKQQLEQGAGQTHGIFALEAEKKFIMLSGQIDHLQGMERTKALMNLLLLIGGYDMRWSDGIWPSDRKYAEFRKYADKDTPFVSKKAEIGTKLSNLADKVKGEIPNIRSYGAHKKLNNIGSAVRGLACELIDNYTEQNIASIDSYCPDGNGRCGECRDAHSRIASTAVDLVEQLDRVLSIQSQGDICPQHITQLYYLKQTLAEYSRSLKEQISRIEKIATRGLKEVRGTVEGDGNNTEKTVFFKQLRTVRGLKGTDKTAENIIRMIDDIIAQYSHPLPQNQPQPNAPRAPQTNKPRREETIEKVTTDQIASELAIFLQRGRLGRPVTIDQFPNISDKEGGFMSRAGFSQSSFYQFVEKGQTYFLPKQGEKGGIVYIFLLQLCQSYPSKTEILAKKLLQIKAEYYTTPDSIPAPVNNTPVNSMPALPVMPNATQQPKAQLNMNGEPDRDTQFKLNKNNIVLKRGQKLSDDFLRAVDDVVRGGYSNQGNRLKDIITLIEAYNSNLFKGKIHRTGSNSDIASLVDECLSMKDMQIKGHLLELLTNLLQSEATDSGYPEKHQKGLHLLLSKLNAPLLTTGARINTPSRSREVSNLGQNNNFNNIAAFISTMFDHLKQAARNQYENIVKLIDKAHKRFSRAYNKMIENTSRQIDATIKFAVNSAQTFAGGLDKLIDAGSENFKKWIENLREEQTKLIFTASTSLEASSAASSLFGNMSGSELSTYTEAFQLLTRIIRLNNESALSIDDEVTETVNTLIEILNSPLNEMDKFARSIGDRIAKQTAQQWLNEIKQLIRSAKNIRSTNELGRTHSAQLKSYLRDLETSGRYQLEPTGQTEVNFQSNFTREREYHTMDNLRGGHVSNKQEQAQSYDTETRQSKPEKKIKSDLMMQTHIAIYSLAREIFHSYSTGEMFVNPDYKTKSGKEIPRSARMLNNSEKNSVYKLFEILSRFGNAQYLELSKEVWTDWANETIDILSKCSKAASDSSGIVINSEFKELKDQLTNNIRMLK